MKILWIPNATIQIGKRSRDRNFSERLSEKGHQIHYIYWDSLIDHKLMTLLNPTVHLKSLRKQRYFEKGIVFHHLPRIHNYFNLFGGGYERVPALNQFLFRRLVRQIIKDYDIEIVICSQNFYLIGFPPFNLEVPLVFDYVDYLDDKWEEIYSRDSSVVLCVSGLLKERASRFNKNVFYLPNSIDIGLHRSANGDAVRKHFKLEGAKIISLIGIQAHTEFYWIEGINLASERIPNLKCMLVGDDRRLLPLIRKKINSLPEKYRKNYIITGGIVAYEDILSFFAATDIGMFPGHKDLPGDAICPVKVIEYTAAGKPVVSVALRELRHWNFPNVIFAEETPESFANGIEFALKAKCSFPDLSNFELNNNVLKLEKILEGLVAKK